MSLRSLIFVSFACASLVACASPTAARTDASNDVEETPGETSDALTSANDLKPAQEKLILKLVDDVCGDSWCEGDYNFKFAKLKCSFTAKTCTITLDIIDPQDGAKPQRDFWRSCKMTKIAGFTSMIDTAPNGFQSLGDDFYSKVDACITKLESHIPAR